MAVRILCGDTRELLKTLPDASVQCCVTSPPYFGLRSYGIGEKNGEIGLEETPDAYITKMVAVFREVRRVLRDDGVLWLNIGDSYNGGGVGGGSAKGAGLVGASNRSRQGDDRKTIKIDGCKPKDLLGIPWMLAFALRADGWYLRSDVIWHKPNPMPESVTDRPTSAHEHVFLLTKSARYYYDAQAIAEEAESAGRIPGGNRRVDSSRNAASRDMSVPVSSHRNARSVWTIATRGEGISHFALMPPELAERCIKAGSKPGDTILDPFAGAGTTGLVADRLKRNCILTELNPEYAALARSRIMDDAGMFAEVA